MYPCPCRYIRYLPVMHRWLEEMSGLISLSSRFVVVKFKNTKSSDHQAIILSHKQLQYQNNFYSHLSRVYSYNTIQKIHRIANLGFRYVRRRFQICAYHVFIFICVVVVIMTTTIVCCIDIMRSCNKYFLLDLYLC